MGPEGEGGAEGQGIGYLQGEREEATQEGGQKGQGAGENVLET